MPVINQSPRDKQTHCQEFGHHWHESDGSVFARHSGREPGTFVSVVCCHCGANADLAAHAHANPVSAPTPQALREARHISHCVHDTPARAKSAQASA